MPSDLPVLADLVADAFDLAEVDTNELLQDAPFAANLPMVPSSNGSTHKWPVQTGAPPVGFRAVNTGRASGHSVDVVRSATLELLDWTVKCDVALAKLWRKGERAYLQRESFRAFLEAMRVYGRQLINGKIGGEANGFTGFRDADTINATGDELVVNAGGSGAECSSVYAIRMGEDDVVGVHIGNTDPISVGDTREELLQDGNGEDFNGYVTPAQTYLGLQVSNKYAIGRIANLDASNGLTDDMIYELESKFPSGRKPTHYLCSRRSAEQLRKSRTHHNPSGAPVMPVDSVAGRTLWVTDEVLDTEAAIS